MCHFPGTFLLGRKDALARHVDRFRRRNGPGSFEYLPRTYLLPRDRPRVRFTPGLHLVYTVFTPDLHLHYT